MENPIEIVTNLDPNLTSGGNIYNAKLVEACKSIGIDMKIHWTSEPESYINQHSGKKLLIIDSVVLNESIDWQQFSKLVFLIHMWPSDESGQGTVTENWVAENFRIIYAGTKAIKSVLHQKDTLTLPPGIDKGWIRRQASHTLPQKLLSIGNINGQKGHVKTLQALIGLNSTKWRWEVYGCVLDKNVFRKLQTLVVDHQLQSQVQFKGEISHQEVNHIMCNADLLVHFSLHETNSMVIREAISSWLPFVSSPTGDFQALRSMNCGVFTNTMKVSELTFVIEELMEPNGNYNMLQSEARKVEIPTWEHTAKKLIKYLDS